MPESQLAIATPRGPEIVACQTGGSIPKGLALTLVPLADSADGYAQWSITHIQSGKRIGPGFEERRDAQRVAEALADCGDWTLPAFALKALPHLEAEVSATLDRVLTELERALGQFELGAR